MKKNLLFLLLVIVVAGGAMPLSAQETVDLGLSVNWAAQNLGAAKPTDAGVYVAWGETEEKADYTWKTYSMCRGFEKTMTKYCVNAYYGTVDNKAQLLTADDAAKQTLGGDWHIPTKVEWEELLEKCTWQWTTVDGVAGYRVAGPSGNSIFLPAAGNKYNQTSSNVGQRGDYWSSTLGLDYSNNGANLTFWNEGQKMTSNFRYYGRTIRPVRAKDAKKKVYDESIDGVTQIDQALARAKAEGKRVICQVGGNWCIWCLRFADFIEKDEQIAKTIADNYVYIHVNTSTKNKNEAALARLGNQQMGYPHLVVLSADGAIVHAQDTGSLEQDKSYDREKVLAFFQQYAGE